MIMDSIFFWVNNLFRSKWSRWVAEDYVVVYHDYYYRLCLIMKRVNSKTGKQQFKKIEIFKSISSWEVDRYAIKQKNKIQNK
jgi:hypothetical protein